jgi:hypothetical protein
MTGKGRSPEYRTNGHTVGNMAARTDPERNNVCDELWLWTGSHVTTMGVIMQRLTVSLLLCSALLPAQHDIPQDR